MPIGTLDNMILPNEILELLTVDMIYIYFYISYVFYYVDLIETFAALRSKLCS